MQLFMLNAFFLWHKRGFNMQHYLLYALLYVPLWGLAVCMHLFLPFFSVELHQPRRVLVCAEFTVLPARL